MKLNSQAHIGVFKLLLELLNFKLLLIEYFLVLVNQPNSLLIKVILGLFELHVVLCENFKLQLSFLHLLLNLAQLLTLAASNVKLLGVVDKDGLVETFGLVLR